MQTKFEVYLDRVGTYRWRLKGGNGEIVATSEGYSTKYAAKESAASVENWARTAIIVEIN